jgi:hypothetical protein
MYEQVLRKLGKDAEANKLHKRIKEIDSGKS